MCVVMRLGVRRVDQLQRREERRQVWSARGVLGSLLVRGDVVFDYQVTSSVNSLREQMQAVLELAFVAGHGYGFQRWNSRISLGGRF